MKKTAAFILAMLMMIVPGFAMGERVFSADTDIGAVLITESGELVTGIGDYDVIDLISYDDCPPERQLFMVSMLDISDGFFLMEDYDEFFGDEDWDYDLDDVEAWPDTEGLDEGYDMEIVDDMPVVSDMPLESEEEVDFGEYFTDDDFDELDGYMDYGVALMNTKGELLTDFEYISFMHDVENAVVAAYDFEGFVTLLDEAGNVLVAGGYTSVVANGQGGYIAVQPVVDPETGDFSETAPIVRISADGEVEETGLYTFAYETLPGYSGGLMCVPVYDGGTGVYAYIYIDAAGVDAFGKKFDYAASFIGGFAEVTGDDYSARLIDMSGEYVTDGGHRYFDMGTEGDGMPIVANLMDGGFELMSKDDGGVIATFLPETEGDMFYAYQSGDGLIVAYSDQTTMIIDGSGNVLYRGEGELYAQTWYEFADGVPGRMLLSDYSDGAMRMCVAEFDGTPVSEWYGDMSALSWVNGQGRYLALDYELTQIEYDDVTGYEPDMETFRYGVVDHDGNVVVELKYDYFMQLASDRYWAAQGGTYSLMDENGGVIAVFE